MRLVLAGNHADTETSLNLKLPRLLALLNGVNDKGQLVEFSPTAR
jgi:hypothetical protein